MNPVSVAVATPGNQVLVPKFSLLKTTRVPGKTASSEFGAGEAQDGPKIHSTRNKIKGVLKD